ncbi:hypothetical protein C0Q44_12135 [Paenibacillus sp. PCH8]|uniref:hypothetical protein n=1 Tax=Paenibacillus sp. PCH8 TaxID=2066524 RepID=UPI000CF9AEAD|nr:hypothetical protein [Paenibacillus sp. PCH8]PQP85199.1 hypothetical protein C0Q44_12135 [Paenibacillus sp. PCH8]
MMNNLDRWLDVSSNFNIFIGVVTFIGIISAFVYTLFLNKIGKKDEYSLQIRLNVTNKMFISLIIVFALFVVLVPNDMLHYKQIIYMCFAVTVLVGAISAAYYYVRDFKN